MEKRIRMPQVWRTQTNLIPSREAFELLHFSVGASPLAIACAPDLDVTGKDGLSDLDTDDASDWIDIIENGT
jgi:hypothetical protein